MAEQELTLKIKDELQPKEITERLVGLGYENVGISTPSNVGQFGRRGNLLDIWLERYKLPVRIDLIGDIIENIYLFNYLTQNKERVLKQLYIIPRNIGPELAPKWFQSEKFKTKVGKVERLFLSEIEAGDLVVHIDYGIGRFLGITDKLSSAFATSQTNKTQTFANQVFIVEYAKGDKLYVPVSQIDRLTKYIGSPGYKPRLNSLGTAGWEKIKSKVAESIVKVAKDLLLLYAKRQMMTRPPFSPDTSWQRQLEESFEYEETADQLKAIAGIKKDLESPKPMDRLLVGDVGFGKTEVAIRAAFKVVQDGKQVALLASTTILVEQHYHLFKDRLKYFPVEVSLLSRFKTQKEQAETITGLKTGKVDIVIGTHRLLSNDVGFRDLELIIIDEEHRFGVAAKEKLKNLKTAVDVLSMSATPIPRTLHMALTKIRDMSLLGQPPAGRQPIETTIAEWDEEKIKNAIEKEINRDGQVYYVFNNVSKIAQKAAQVLDLVPSARVVFAHGQMRGAQLESQMGKFFSGSANVLVCTTIIGSGLDMPNVNTIIIEDAQRFGLSDLHQLRGRVGRSERKAFAHLFYPKNYVPAGDVLERLLAVRASTQLGAGFSLAKKDLEIRGAGNLLGTAQHGNIALIGFELYIQLLSQTIEKLKH